MKLPYQVIRLNTRNGSKFVSSYKLHDKAKRVADFWAAYYRKTQLDYMSVSVHHRES